MKKILILTPRYLYPVIGGDRLRMYQICKELSKHYHLTLLSLCDSEYEMKMTLPNDGIFKSIERIYQPKWRSLFNCIRALPGSEPLQVAYYSNKNFQHRAAALMSEHDATFAHLIRIGDVIKEFPGIKFLEMTDAISLNYDRIRQTGHAKKDLRSYIFSLEAKRLLRYELSITKFFNHSFLVSNIDCEFLFGKVENGITSVSVCSNGVDLHAMPFGFTEEGSDIIFIGNMNSLQNLDAANFMVNEVLPIIRCQHPGAVLRLIGRIRPEDAARFSRVAGVKVSGEVVDVAIAAQGGGVGVCPLRLGAGVQNKLLEYMALGLPTVSTSLGLEGLNARDGFELLVANDPTSLAQSLLCLMNDRKKAKLMAIAARDYIEANHSWEAQLAPMIAIIGKAIERGNPVC